ncbi:hypothetical protein L6R29_11620 [Myxococcota bacterium]|nr:hypothetical protein [Myxococcota bacterium]
MEAMAVVALVVRVQKDKFATAVLANRNAQQNRRSVVGLVSIQAPTPNIAEVVQIAAPPIMRAKMGNVFVFAIVRENLVGMTGVVVLVVLVKTATSAM